VRRLVCICTAALALAPLAAASIPRADYRSDGQAEYYLKHGLKRWAGRSLTTPGLFKSAFCVNGYYSRHEKRTGRHFHPVERVNKRGEYLFRSFACTLSAGSHEYALYLVTLPRGTWSVSADR